MNEKLSSRKATSVMQSTGTPFFTSLWSNNLLLFKFYYLLIFFLALIKWNSSPCQLMKLYKSKECFKEKVDSNNNWKSAWSRMILEWHLFWELSLGFRRMIFSFCWKTSKFLPKDVCLISVYFYLDKKELIQ